MSVLIKGMKMPESCTNCELWADCSEVAWYMGEDFDYEDLMNGELNERIHSNCPLVEVPEPHGRLVEFIEVATQEDEDSGLESVNLGDVFAAYVKMREAKPVIEAEGEQMNIEEMNILQDIVDIYEKEDIYPLLNDKQVRTIKKAIEALKAQEWIPCSERLPEENVPVNVTWVNRVPEPYYADIKDKPFTATGVYFKGKWYWYSSTVEDLLAKYGRAELDDIEELTDNSIEILAWMPLPQSYKAESEEV